MVLRNRVLVAVLEPASVVARDALRPIAGLSRRQGEKAKDHPCTRSKGYYNYGISVKT